MMKLAGAIEVVVRPHRGLDLGAASFAGQPFAWLTPLGEDAPTVAGDWWASWGGGLMTTAGLDNIASPPTGFRSTGRTQGNVDIDSEAVEPRDAASAAGNWRMPGAGDERVYEHLGALRSRVRIGDLIVEIRSSLPRLWQWVHPGRGVVGIEPANCSVRGRAFDASVGRLPFLQPGEVRESSLDIMVAPLDTLEGEREPSH